MFDDLSERALKTLEGADHDQTVALLNQALRITAACQQRLKISTVRSTLEAGGEVAISLADAAQSQSVSAYASVDRDARQLTITGSLPSAPGEDYRIPNLIDPKG